MAQEYLVTQFKKGDFQDNHGNYWCDMALKGVGEPVRIVVKDPMQYSDGMTLYGEVKEQESKKGNTYLRFYREQRPDGEAPTYANKGQDKPNDQYWEDRNDAIKAQWALGRSYEKHGATPEAIKDARWLFENANSVGGSEGPDPKDTTLRMTSATQTSTKPSGYDKFKASKPTPKQEDDAETASLVAKMEETMNEPIDMSEIPF